MRKLSNKTMMSGGHCLRWWGGALFVLTVPALGWSDHATHVPPRFVSDPNFEWTGSGFEVGLVDTVRRELLELGGAVDVALVDVLQLIARRILPSLEHDFRVRR